MRTIGVLSLAAFAMLLLMGPMCPKRVSARTSAPGDWRLLFIGELNGHMEPCGCTTPQVGGLARLSTFVRKYASDPRAVAVFNGDMIPSPDAQSQIKVLVLAPYFDSLKFAAINLGETDLALGISTLTAYQSSYRLPMLCGNLTDASGNRPFPLLAQKDNAGGKLTIIGLLSPHYESTVAASCPGYSLGDIEPCLTEAQQSCAKGQPAVLLYHGTKEEATDIAKKAPWLTAIVYAHNGDQWTDPFKVGTVWLMDAGQEGKIVGEVRLNGADTPSATRLGPEFADDKQYDGIRDMYLSELKSKDLLAASPKVKTANGATYVGTALCAECHDDPHKVWATSKHANAFATLTKVKHEYDPECVGCHSVGFKNVSGFASPDKTPKLENVGCESCHGPGSLHATDHSVSMKTKGEATCTECHTIENSPSFKHAEYWAKVKH